MGFPMILLGILIIFAIVFYVVIKNQEKKSSINSKDKYQSDSERRKAESKKKATDEVRKEDVFKFMEFDKILDNMIVQRNGTKFTMAIKCKGINYDLMSEIEQLSVEEGFITFLNTLRYPIQLYVQAQNIDLKGAINTYKKNVTGIRDELDRVTDEYTKIVDQFDASEDELAKTDAERAKVLNVYEYANDIINYVERLSLNKSLLQRNFYVLVSYNTSEIISIDNFNKDEIVNICYNELLTRAQSIISGLSSCSVTGTALDSNEVADLLYTAYNRDDKGLVSVKEAIESGFYRLYSTSEDAFYKKQEIMIEQINNEAKIKAIEAIQKAIDDGTYIPPEAQELAIHEQISKTASEMVKNENIPQDIKDAAKNILVDDYRDTKQKIKDKIVSRTIKYSGQDESNQTELNDQVQVEKKNDVAREDEIKQVDRVVENEPIKDEPIKNNDIVTNDIGLIIENDDSKPDIQIEEEPEIIPQRPEPQPITVIDDDRLGSDTGDIFDDRLGGSDNSSDDDTSDDQIIR